MTVEDQAALMCALDIYQLLLSIIQLQEYSPIPRFGLLTNPSINIINEIKEIKRLKFDYVEIAIEGPEGHPSRLKDKQNEIIKLLSQSQFSNNRPLGHTVPWADLGSDYERIRHAWIAEALEEIKLAKELGIALINFHSSVNGMFFADRRRRIVLDNWINSLHGSKDLIIRIIYK